MTATTLFLRQLLPEREKRLLAVAGFWTIVAVLSSFHWWYLYTHPDPYTSYWQVLRVKLAVWYLWGAITPIFFLLADRFPLSPRRWLWHGVLLTASATLIAFVYSILYAIALLINLERPLNETSITFMTGFVVSTHTTYYILAGLAAIVLEHALRFMQNANERSVAESDLQKRLAKAEWDRLQAQLNPHFLFNLLNTCAARVMTESKEEAYRTLVSVSDLLRDNMHHVSRQVVPLKDEVRFVERYLDLVLLRYAHRLKTEIKVDPAAEEVPVPSHALFTLVENAVKHGATAHSGSHLIRVLVTFNSRTLALSVENSVTQSGQEEPHANGTGLKNLDARLLALYGTGAYSLSSGLIDGLNTVTITLPLPPERSANVTPH